MAQTSAPLAHWPDADLSLFQTSIAAVEQRAAAAPAVDHQSPMLQAVAQAAAASPAATAIEAQRSALRGVSSIEHCAALYLALARAEASRDDVQIAAARAALPKYGPCDGKWEEALAEFLTHAALRLHTEAPYRPWRDLADFVIPDPRDPQAAPILGDKARVAIISDWGTGEARAQALLEAVAALQPDVVIHLGDIYYAGAESECAAFYANIRAVFPSQPVFTLCGNHDMYSGGKPYYALLDKLGQPSSYFALRNAHWQLLALDTGFNDYDPFREAQAMTWLRDGTGSEGEDVDDVSELDWLADKVANAGGRRTILMSHHPLFTRRTPIAGSQVCNMRLLGQVQTWLDQVTLWLWGHEHCQLLYEPFAGLKRGRCLGASAIPTLPADDPYGVSTKFAAGQTPPGLIGGAEARLAVDPATGWYDLGFAMLQLNGVGAEIVYYGWDQRQGARPLYRETL